MNDDPRHEPQRGPILLCAGTDPAAAARLARTAASLLADRPAVVLATWEPPPIAGMESALDALYDTHEELRAAARNNAVRTARAACEELEAHGVHVTRQICPEEQSPWQEIIDLADELDAAVIVAGTNEHPGPLGGQARALAHRAHRPLLLVPESAGGAERVAAAIFAYDGSPAAGHAVAIAAQLLRPRPAIVASVWSSAAHVVGVAMLAVPDDVVRKGAASLDAAARLRAADRAGDGAAQLRAAGWAGEALAIETSRNVVGAIVDAADEHDAAIVVTGTRGRSRVAAALLGSSAEGILRCAGRPVLLVAPAS
jgi:nucleotide-binding universal stress UspA family protein